MLEEGFEGTVWSWIHDELRAAELSDFWLAGWFANWVILNLFERVGPCDVTSKKDLEKLVDEISKKEKYINLLGTIPLSFTSPFLFRTWKKSLSNSCYSSPSQQRRHWRPKRQSIF